MGRIIYTVAFVLLGTVIGKACQYAMVAFIGPRAGFELASLIGLTPFVAVLIFLKARYPRYFSFRAIGR